MQLRRKRPQRIRRQPPAQPSKEAKYCINCHKLQRLEKNKKTGWQPLIEVVLSHSDVLRKARRRPAALEMHYAAVAELAYAHDSGSCPHYVGSGSSPVSCTKMQFTGITFHLRTLLWMFRFSRLSLWFWAGRSFFIISCVYPGFCSNQEFCLNREINLQIS